MDNIDIDKASRISKLIVKQWEKELDETEKTELTNWLNESENNIEVYKKLCDERRLTDDLLEMEQFDVEFRVKKIIRRISGKHQKIWTLYKIAAAACIILLAGAGIYTFKIATGKKKIPAEIVKKVSSEPKGAVLILDNGVKINLDSSADGIIAVQGNTKIIKKEGRLIYIDRNTGEPVTAYNTISTAAGKQFQFSLADGSLVWLNAGSSISFPTNFSNTERRVAIKGEAYFEIAKIKRTGTNGVAAKIPFIVEDGQNKNWGVTVLGTHFNVNAYDDGNAVNTTLLEGSVKFAGIGQSSVVLVPGQQAQLKKGNDINVLSNVNLSEVIAWKNGIFDFHDSDLETILKSVARWYDLQVVYKDFINDKYTINIPRNVPLPQLLDFVEKSGGVHFEIKGATLIVRK